MASPIFCDFNNWVDRATYSLNAIGSRADIAALSVATVLNQPAVFYDYDALENGDPAWLLADGVVQADRKYGFVAKIDPESFRWAPRGPDESRPAV
jgi:hypothetical protein